jgi:hypothetical protein
MEAPAGQQWFLRKHEDGNIFGPLTFEQLAGWASSARVAPNDSLSVDQTNWIKAPMLPELQMDWIVEVTSERYYGPTTLGAVNEFIGLEEINEDSFLINACDGTREQIKGMVGRLQAQAAERETREHDAVTTAIDAEPTATVITLGMQNRIRELEESIRERRRALIDAEERYRDLEAKYLELLGSRSTL